MLASLSIYNYTINNMEKIYAILQKDCKLYKARPETINMLMGFSKSLHVVEYGEFKFENNLN